MNGEPTGPSLPPRAGGFEAIERALADLKAGKAVVVIDDEDRENEGDLIFAAEMATPEQFGKPAAPSPHKLRCGCAPRTAPWGARIRGYRYSRPRSGRSRRGAAACAGRIGQRECR